MATVPEITWADFERVDLRVGTVTAVEEFPEARKRAYKLKIDFGANIGTKRSCAQLVKTYSRDALIGRLVLGVVNFPARQIGPAASEVLTLGVPDNEGNCILITPERDVALGGKLF